METRATEPKITTNEASILKWPNLTTRWVYRQSGTTIIARRAAFLSRSELAQDQQA
jgi:hypothetical protein